MLKSLKRQSKQRILLRLKIKRFLCRELWQHIIVLSFIAFVAWLFDKPIETALFCVSHVVIRQCFKKQFHFGSVWKCLILTLSVIWFGVSALLPISVSLLSAVPVCFGIAYLGFVVQDRIDVRNQLKLHKKLPPEEEFIRKCHDAKLSKRNTEIARQYYVERHTPKEIWLWLCQSKEYEDIAWDSVYQLLWRIGKKLNK